MNNKMVRFLNSLEIRDIDRFDMDFDLVSRNQFIPSQIDMFIVKDTPWSYALLEEFQNGLAIIGYPYTIQFSYKRKPSVYDAISLFDDWHRSHNRYQAEITLEGNSNIITFVYKSEQQKQQYEQVVKDFMDFLDFLCYRFEFDHEIREEEATAPNVSQRQLRKLEAEANKVASEEVEEESETSYYKDRDEIEADQEELRQVEEEYIKNLRENLEQMKSDQKKGKTVYKNWRDKIPYAIVKDMSLLDENSGNVDLNGELFAIDKPRTLRGGRMMLTFGIGNPTGAINVKAVEGEYITAEDLESYKNGMYARIAGYVDKDKFSGQPVLQARAIELLPPPELRKDNEPAKRVELHLHTKMSIMDGVTDIGKYVELASHMGHKAIAITDHGVTQGFPDAAAAAEKYGVKMIYGSELYMVNDELPFALNPTDELLRSASYVVFDLETTGLSTRYDRITEFGGVRFEHGQVVDSLGILINPECEIPAKIVEKTKITNEMVKNKPTIAQAIDRILEFMKGAILVSHNITFDYGFINENLKKLGREKLIQPAIDTLSLSHYLFPEANKHTLGALSRNLGITSYNDEEAHRADYDARILNEVWLAMLNRITKENYDIKHSDLAKIKSTNAMLKHIRASHITCLAKNKEGFHDLNELISESHIDFLADVPKTPKREIARLRKNLLLGSACLNGEIFEIERTRSKEDLLEAMKFYDFIEVQPPANYSHLINRGSCYDFDEIKKYIKDIVECADELGITCVATGDVHYANPEDKIIRDIYIEAPAVGGKPHPLNIRNKNCEAPDQHYRSTKEMLDAFEFLGKEKAFEIVVTNTNKIADMFPGDISPIQKELHAPVIENSPQILTDTCYENAKAIYGDPLPEEIQVRLQKELDGIIKNGYSVTYYIANRIVKKANEDGYMVGSRGSVGSSFAAHMFGITEVNPLRPHYHCPKCKHLEFIDSPQYLSGYDLPDKRCPICGEKMIGDGQNIPFETFLGFNAEKIPDIDLNFPSDYQAKAFDLTKVIFGPNNVFRAGTIETVAEKTAFGYVRRYFEHKGQNPDEVNPALIAYLASHATDVKRTTGQHPGGIMVLPKGLSIYDFTPIQYPADDKESTWLTTHLAYTALHDALLKLDLLGHVDPLALRMMSEMTGIDVKKIPLNDQKVISLFTSDKALQRKGNYLAEETGAVGLPEFGTQTGMDILKDANPKSFADLVVIAGLAHGTDVWNNNARDLIKSGQCTIRDVIGCRDDIMTYLISKGVASNIAFKVMEDVRKGKKVKPEYEAVLRANNVPDWYIDSCNKIKYMFPKAHAVAYVTMAVRVGYFKLYHPLEFYAVWFTARCKAYDIKAMLGGKEGIIARYNELKIKKTNKTDKLSPKETEIMKMLTIAIEMTERGYKFSNIDLYKSQASQFIVDHETQTIIPPFIVIDGLGENAAISVVEARENGRFSSKEDLLKRTKLNGTNVDDLAEIGVLDGLGDSDQMSLFEFGLED